MGHFTDDIHPVSDLRRKAHALVRQSRETGRPVVITQRGRTTAVLVSVEAWERMEERQAVLEAMLQGERDFTEGRVVESDAAFDELRAAAKGSKKGRR